MADSRDAPRTHGEWVTPAPHLEQRGQRTRQQVAQVGGQRGGGRDGALLHLLVLVLAAQPRRHGLVQRRHQLLPRIARTQCEPSMQVRTCLLAGHLASRPAHTSHCIACSELCAL